MSNYTKLVDYAEKDDLLPNEPEKIIKGVEFDAEFIAISEAVNSKADKISPALTGAPTVPTAPLGDNSTKIANTAFVVREINSAVAAGTEGLDGNSYFAVDCFIRSTTQPATPSGGSFNFESLSPSAPTGWYIDIPTGTDPVYKSTAIASTVGGVVIDTTLTWSYPVKAFEDGAAGSGTDTLSANGFLYYTNGSSTAPVVPTDADTYDYVFPDNVFTVIKAGWSTKFTASTIVAGQKYWAVDYYVEKDENDVQTVTIGNTAFAWLNFDGLITFTNLADTWNTEVTSISGGKITTGTLNASAIATGTLSASQIATGSMSADRISGGTITGINITGANITATSADGGSLSVSSSTEGTIFSASTASGIVGYRRLAGYNIEAGNLASPSVAVVKGTTIGTSSASGVQGIGNSSGHGVNGINTTYSAEGFVGTALGGGYDFYAYGSAANYGSFTGAHDCLLPLDHSVEVGDLVYDVEVVSRKGYSNTITKVASTTTPNQKAVVGVLVKISNVINETNCPAAFKETSSITDAEGNVETTTEYTLGDAANNYYWSVVNSIGEGQINVCGEGGNIEAGDLIVSSSIKGKGMKQADDIIRGYTVAKARESVTFTSADEVKQIACIYVAG